MLNNMRLTLIPVGGLTISSRMLLTTSRLCVPLVVSCRWIQHGQAEQCAAESVPLDGPLNMTRLIGKHVEERKQVLQEGYLVTMRGKCFMCAHLARGSGLKQM
jgi:hypothetical protein